MEVLSSEIVRETPILLPIMGLLFGAFLVFLALWWIVDIIKNKYWDSNDVLGMLTFILLGLFFLIPSIMNMHENTKKEVVNATVTNWNVVYDEGWEVVDRKDELVELERVIGK